MKRNDITPALKRKEEEEERKRSKANKEEN